ncbi:hypothetical protein RI367_003322 [Sorochytrium milnesiophthora]
MRFTLIALVAFAALAVEVTASPILARRGADNEFKLRARSPAGNDKLAQIEALLTKAFGAAGNIGKVASDVVGVVNDVSGGNVVGAITDGINGAKDIAGVIGQLKGGAGAAAGGAAGAGAAVGAGANLSAGADLSAGAGVDAGVDAGADASANADVDAGVDAGADGSDDTTGDDSQ